MTLNFQINGKSSKHKRNCRLAISNYASKLVYPNYIFFLTHWHSDHYKGLTPTWNRGPIYCSPETAILLRDLYPKIPRIISLELNVPHWITVGLSGSQGVNVTLIDANHCLGSVMILFQSEATNNILYTGDFRFISSMLQHPALLDSSGNIITINHLYLDNTFSDPEFNFPPQEECTQMIIKAIEENPNSDVWIKSGCFGREKLLLNLSIHFNTLVVVDPKTFKVVSLLGVSPERFSTNENEGFIRIVNNAQMKELYERNKNQMATIGIWLSGWCKEYSKSDEFGVVKYRIPYSGHSNSKEIKEFTKAIDATRVTFTSSCAGKSRGNYAIMEETYSTKTLETPRNSVDIIPVKRRIISNDSSHLKKTKKPKKFGPKIIDK